MSYLLNVLYLIVLLAASPWLVFQAVTKGKYRSGFAAKVLGRVPQRRSDRLCVWLHAVSVGEVNLLAPLIAEIERRLPDWECVVSTTTVTGYELARTRYPRLSVFYCPLDFSWAVRTAMRRVRPSLLVLAELELWPNLIRSAGESGARVGIVNGRLSERSFRGYLRVRPLIAPLLRRLDLVAAQTEEYAERFRVLGALPDRVHVTGSLKFDGAQTNRNNPATRRLASLAGFAEADTVFLAGSTQEPEEALAIETFRSLAESHPRLRLVVVPRHRERFESVARLLQQSGLAWQRRTGLQPSNSSPPSDASPRLTAAGPPSPQPPRVLLVDAIGELAAWWGAAHIAFVGGSLGQRGGQNMIEPAAYGAAVSFGPNTRNFRDVVQALLQHEAAVVVYSGEDLTAFVRRCLEDEGFAAELGRSAQSFVAGQLGATARTVQLLESLFTANDANDRAAA